jgi:hypothetical protein
VVADVLLDPCAQGVDVDRMPFVHVNSVAAKPSSRIPAFVTVPRQTRARFAVTLASGRRPGEPYSDHKSRHGAW